MADATSTDNGQIAVSQNTMVAFYELEWLLTMKTIVISERLMKKSRFSTIHLMNLRGGSGETQSLVQRVTTPEYTNVSELKLRNLDERE